MSFATDMTIISVSAYKVLSCTSIRDCLMYASFEIVNVSRWLADVCYRVNVLFQTCSEKIKCISYVDCHRGLIRCDIGYSYWSDVNCA